jgi:NMD protein affecting ribosome stability and mRNA decay
VLYAHVERDGKDLRLPVKLSYMQCDFGQKQKTGYFEGILQLRNPSDDSKKFIEDDLRSVAHKGVFVSKAVDVKNGVDLYFTNKNHMRLLAQRLHNRFGGVLKINSQLFSHNHETSKDIFRVNAYVELPLFKKGDVISFLSTAARIASKERQYVKVTSMGKLMQGFNLLTGKRTAFELRYVDGLKIESVQQSTIVNIENKNFFVLNPETFQEELVVNSSILSKEHFLDEKISLVKTDKGFVVVE